jgi:hypothetical protein
MGSMAVDMSMRVLCVDDYKSMLRIISNLFDRLVAAKQADVNNYIVKLFNAETLKQKIVSVLGQF